MTKMTQWEKDSSQQIDAAGDGHVSKGNGSKKVRKSSDFPVLLYNF